MAHGEGMSWFVLALFASGAASVALSAALHTAERRRAARAEGLRAAGAREARVRAMAAMSARAGSESVQEAAEARLSALRLLGFSPNAEPEDESVRQAWRTAARAAHPDMGGRATPSDRLQRLREARDLLLLEAAEVEAKTHENG